MDLKFNNIASIVIVTIKFIYLQKVLSMYLVTLTTFRINVLSPCLTLNPLLMKQKFCYFLLFAGVFIIFACSDSKEKEIKGKCGSGEVVYTFKETQGTIQLDEQYPELVYIDIGDAATSIPELKTHLLPCNLLDEYKKNGLQIVFSGELEKEIKDTVNPADAVGQFVYITSIKHLK